ncbi:hypothetical protein TH61_03835 [Rufibacter sp. DG15C]|uniref:DUF3999 family protein n=1 Tax=Rufibacter sp. DG15C TaxID=1379909 RepID=UPI00078DCFFE|nr:DUF3999 family protein [Rufibacter sp. DG15C]AMM50491.1 hypothetical protein TH61_03835 [Rufibacter sp. DG15C]
MMPKRLILPLILQKRSLFLLAFLLGWMSARAQDFGWKATLSPVSTQGWHRVLLPASVTGRLQAGLEDLRLYSADGKEVPYLLQTEQPVQYRTLFKPYQVLRYTRQPGGLSELLIHNPEQRSINNISLLIGNAEVRKTVALSGSDNQQDWYVLKEQDVLYAIRNEKQTAEVKLLDFPLSKYRYFRLQLNDSASAPLNILKAGYYDTYSEAGKYTRIPIQHLSRKDSSNKTTYLRLDFGQPEYPEQLVFYISATQLYYREGKVILGKRTGGTRREKKRRRRNQTHEIYESFTLHSNAPAQVNLPRQKVERLVIQLQNKDNQPLKIDSIQVLQLNRYAVAQLQPSQTYTLRYGDEDVPAPNYDLQFFQDSIPANLPVVTVKAITSLKEEKPKSQGSKMLMWAVIGVVAIGLGYMTLRLLKDMDKKRGI